MQQNPLSDDDLRRAFDAADRMAQQGDRQATEDARAFAQELQRRGLLGQQQPSAPARPQLPEWPEDVADRQAREANAPPRQTPQQRAEEFVSRTNRGWNPVSFFGRGIPQGMNLSDEMQAVSARASNAYDTVFGPPGGVPREPLDPNLVAEAERNRVATARTERPVTTGLTEGFAALPTALIGPAGATWRTAAGAGALFGTIAGWGGGETPTERATGSVIGAGTGAGIGVGLYGAGRAVEAVSRPLRRAVDRWVSGEGRNMTVGQRRAFARLRSAFEQDGMTPEDVRRTLNQYVESGFDDAVLLDAGGDAVRREVRRAAGTAGPGSSRAETFLEGRLETHAGRVSETLSEYIDPAMNFRSEAEALVTRRAKAAAPLYQQAFGADDAPVTIPRADVAEVLDRMPRRARAVANRLAGIEGRSAGALDGDEVSVRDLHMLKMALDDMISSARRGQNSIGNTERRALEQLRRDLLDAMPDNYRSANAQFSTDSAMLDALAAGRSALRDDAEDLAATVAEMSPAELEMFRIGLVRGIQDRAARVRDGRDVVGTIFGTPDLRTRIRLGFDSDEAFAAFEQAMRAEQQRIGNARFVAASQGSQTNPRGADMADAQGVVSDLSRGDVIGAGGRVVGRVSDMVRGTQNAVRDSEIVRLATTPMSGQEMDALIADIADRFGQETANRVRRLLASRGAAVSATVGANGVGQEPARR